MVKICFILGIMPRCGTNFLQNILRLHSQCLAPGPVWEDFLISQSDTLLKYSKNVSSKWDGSWFDGDKLIYKYSLLEFLGQGIQNFLRSQLPENQSANKFKFIISKTPTIKGVDKYPIFFKDSKLIILIRDGRSVVASGEKTFSWDFEKSTFLWKLNARKIINFQANKNNNQYLFVKFENLVLNPGKQLTEVFEYLGLTLKNFDFNELAALPVSGSSDLSSSSNKVHWKPIAKKGDFAPLARYSNWSLVKRKIFYYLTNKEMDFFGYISDIELSAWDKLWIPIYLITWPFRFLFRKTIYSLSSLINKIKASTLC